MRWLLLIAVLGVALSAAGAGGSARSAQARWVITSLDAGSDWQGTTATAINQRGEIVGDGGVMLDSHAEMDWHAFLWRSGKMVDFALFNRRKGGTYSYASAINQPGQVVGASDTKAGVRHAYLWQDGRIRDLGTLPGKKESGALAINERGQIAGNSFTDAVYRTGPLAFVWQHGKLIGLGTLGGRSSMALALNQRGQIVGWSETKSGARHAFLWQRGRMRDLGVLPGTRGSTAVAINEHGQVTGYSFAKLPNNQADDVDQLPRAFVWQNGKMAALETPGARYSEAVAINDRGQVIGNTLAQKRLTRGFVWQSGHTTYLVMPRWAKSTKARAINQRGQIVGLVSPEVSGGLSHAALWENGKLTDLRGTRSCSADDPYALASALNEHNQIVGMCGGTMDFAHALLWTLRPGS